MTNLNDLMERHVSTGGFANEMGGAPQAEATAWALCILQHQHRGQRTAPFHSDHTFLKSRQLEDGRVPIAPNHPEAVWPTPLAILAWHGSSEYRPQQDRAIQFLLTQYGHHWTRDPEQDDSVVAHDPSLHGWPWISHTHSWVSPTTHAMLALTITGHGEHERVQEGAEMLIDRQLPHGGWNYGNTFVWGQELRPFPETTGMTLNALAGRVPRSRISRSLDYLLLQLPDLQTPLALGWTLLGLSAWSIHPAQKSALITRCLQQQERYGPYMTSAYCLLLAAAIATMGLESLFDMSNSSQHATLGNT
ncbi:MAG: hypothetical protein MRJ96_10010 [Nitrospirales bacterium]|nr:hypothetical protein [Nitrospira sp.]MDR4501771.1 hypothetical protein [Nitrospirales bacterium]